MVEEMNMETIAVVRVERETSEQFGVGVGLRQGSVLSPLLFIMVMNLISGKVSEQEELKKILYADDIAVVADNKEDLQKHCKKTVMSCPDVMFYVTSEANARVDELHTDRIPVLRESVLNRVVFPDGRGELNFSCKEAGTSCSYRAGVILPICCVRNLLRVVRDVMAVCEKIGIYCQVDSGTAMGALKFNGILPWELDADILYIPVNRTSFWYHKDEFAKLGYKFSLKYPSQCHQFDQKNYRCIHFDVVTEGFRLELFGDLPRSRPWQEFPKKDVLLPTKMLISGLWVNAPINPGLTMHNRYGNEILKHVEHWMLYGRKFSWDLYNSGQFKPCPNPGMHYCLDQYSPDGSFEFQKP